MGKLLRFRRRGKRPTQRGLFEEPSPSDATALAPPPSDAEALAHEDRVAPGDPEVERRLRLRLRRRAALAAVVFAFGVGLAIFGERGYLDVRRSREAQAVLQEQVEIQKARVMALRREVDRLQTDPRAVERIAREELGLALPGEVVLALPPSPGTGLETDGAFAIVPGLTHEP